MFYCDGCADKNAWPLSFFRSSGVCEVCSKVHDCNDTLSKYLPAWTACVNGKVKVNYVQRIRNDLAMMLPENCPDDLIDYYIVLVLVKGQEVTLEDVHDAWSVWRNKTNPDHRSLIPFDQLSTDVQQLDEEFRQAICIVAKWYSTVALWDSFMPKNDSVLHHTDITHDGVWRSS